MEKIFLSRPAFTALLETLVELEDNQAQLIDYFYPLANKQRKLIEKLLNDYLRQINSIIEQIEVVENTEFNDFPVAVCGANLLLRNLTTQNTAIYRLALPTDKAGLNSISIFSALGKMLLLKPKGESVKAKNATYQLIKVYF